MTGLDVIARLADTTVAAVDRFAKSSKITLSEAIDRVDETDLAARARSAVGEFGSLMRKLRERVDDNDDPATVLQHALDG